MKLQLNEAHQSLGATFSDFFGWEVPQSFSTPEEEYEALSQSAGLLDLSASVVLEIRGDDRTRFLHGMLTNDIKSLTPGKGCYAAFLTPQGRMIADLRVFCLDDSLLITAEASVRDRLEPSLRKYIVGGRPELFDRAGELALLSLQGPKATDVLAAGGERPVPVEQAFEHCLLDLGGTAVRALRVARTPAGGSDLMVPRAALEQCWQFLLEQGRSLGLRPVGNASAEVQRIEAGLPLFGVDIEDDTLPIEAGLEQNAISFNKGCYIGQESVARITYRGHVNRKLSGLALEGTRAASKGDRIVAQGQEAAKAQEAGWITSSAYSPRLRHAIALGYVRKEFLEPGTPVSIEATEGRVEAKIQALPFLRS